MIAKIILILLSFIGTIFFVFFIELLFSNISLSSLLIIGIIFGIISIYFFNKTKEILIVQFAFILNIASEIMILMGLKTFFHIKEDILFLSILALQGLYFILIKNSIYRKIVSFIIGSALIFYLNSIKIDFKIIKLIMFALTILTFFYKRDLFYGISISLIFWFGFIVNYFKNNNQIYFSIDNISSIIIFALISLFALYKILKDKTLNKTTIFSLIGIVLLTILYFKTSTIAIILFLMILSFYGKESYFLILFFIALIAYIFKYYYDMNVTLLYKSILLIVSGIVMLTFRYILRKSFKNE